MNWLLVAFLFVLPWTVVPHWFDGSELPKALLGIGAMCLWLMLRGAHALLGTHSAREPRRWSAFALWIGLLGGAGFLSWICSAHRSISWFGNQAQLSTSFLVVITALWLIVSVRDGFQRSPQVARLWLRSWFLGMCVAIFGTVVARMDGMTWLPHVFQTGMVLDRLLAVPLAVGAGLALLATRASVSAPLTARGVQMYRLSHGLLACILIGLLLVGLIVDLQLLWLIVLFVAVATFAIVAAKQRRVSLAGFLSLLAIIAALVGFGQFHWPGQTGVIFSTPGWIMHMRGVAKIDQLGEVLPNQALSWRIVGGALKDAPVFGAGPGAWSYVAERERPLELNKTALWAVRFPRAASGWATVVAEYGLIPSLVAMAFVLMLVVLAVRAVKRDRSTAPLWGALLVLSAVGTVGLRPMNLVTVYSVALFVGLLAGYVFGEGRVLVPQVEQRSVRRALVAVAFVLVVCASTLAIRRAAAAELLTSYAPYALTLARRLNPADDFTFAREATILLQQAQIAGNEQQIALMERILDRADELIQTARTRNPNDAEHVSLALQAARLRAAVNPEKEEQVLVLAAELDRLRPTDPSSPLSVFAVQRERMARETRWVEQGQGREKEEALRRENQAKTAADEALREAVRRKPEYLPALYAQAAWLAQLGQVDQSIRALEALASQGPATPDTALPLALLYRRNQEPMKATAVLQQLVERFPNELEYAWQLSLALAQAEQFDAATTVLQRLVAQDPSNTRYQTQLRAVLRERAQRVAPAVTISPTTSSATATSTKPLPTPRSTTNTRTRRIRR